MTDFKHLVATHPEFEKLAEAWGLDADGNPPPLHPDLAEYVIEGVFGPVLKHPLVFQVPYMPHLAGVANQQYEHKLEALKTADPYSYVFLHERAYRAWALDSIAWKTTHAEFWDLVAAVWIDTENLWQEHDTWRALLTCGRPGRRKGLMDDDERAALAALPSRITIYRGTNAPDGMGAGLSWTLDRDRAEWFASRLDHRGDPARVLTGTVKKSQIIALFLGRNEDEIVVLPEHVTIEEVL